VPCTVKAVTGRGSSGGGLIAQKCYVEFIAFAVVIVLSVGLALAVTRLLMGALVSAMTHHRSTNATAEPAATRVPAATGRARVESAA
jgi:hypothetical protein